MEFNFPKLPNLIPANETEEVPEKLEQRTEGKQFPISQIEQVEQEKLDDVPLPLIRKVKQDELLDSGRLRFLPENPARGAAEPLPGRPRLPVPAPPPDAPPRDLPVDPGDEVVPADVEDPIEDTLEIDTSADETTISEKTDELPIEGEVIASDAEPEIEAESNLSETSEKAAIETQTSPVAKPDDSETPPNINIRSESTNIAEIISSTTSKTYSIGVGQSLEQVAGELKIDVFDLLRANPHLLKDPLLFAGQRVKVPNTAQPENRPEANIVSSAEFAPIDEQIHTISRGALFQQSIELEPVKSTIAESVDIEEIPARSREGIQRQSDEPDSALSRPANEETRESRSLKDTVEAIPTFGMAAGKEREAESDEESRPQQSSPSIPEPFDEWAGYIYSAAEQHDLVAALIVSIIWHESGGRNIIGRDGHGHGLMQIDDRRHSDWLAEHSDGLDPASNIDFGASLLRKNIDHFRGKLASGIAAFDCGIDAVEEALVLGKSVDHFTRDGNYSISVLTQMDYFRRYF